MRESPKAIMFNQPEIMQMPKVIKHLLYDEIISAIKRARQNPEYMAQYEAWRSAREKTISEEVS